MNTDKESKGIPIVLAGLLSGQKHDLIIKELLSLGLTKQEAQELLLRSLSVYSERADEISKHFPNPNAQKLKMDVTPPNHSKESTSSGIKYFESPITPQDKFICSDDLCPCPGNEHLIPGKTGFLYISKEVVSMREDALTWKELFQKLQTMQSQMQAHEFIEGGVVNPIFMCEQGARRRKLNLNVAASDAEYWAKTGLCPLRTTSNFKKWWQFWKTNSRSVTSKLSQEEKNLNNLYFQKKKIDINQMEKICAKCGANVSSNQIKCEKCGSGKFMYE